MVLPAIILKPWRRTDLTSLREDLAKAFTTDKQMLLLECGQRVVESMLKEELEKISHDLLERRVKLDGLKKKNAQTAATIREKNAELQGRIPLI